MSAEPTAVDPSQPTPVYAQLKTHLIQSILNGSFGPDGQLPTEFEICRDYGLSRTPVHRALSELASEGVIIRYRRRGTFVNPDWVDQHAEDRQLTAVVPRGPWADLLMEEAPEDLTLSVVVVELDELHDHLARAVASGVAPDVAVLDSVWVPEYASADFLWPIDEIDATWTHDYREQFARAFVDAQLIDDASVAVQLEADVAGIWFNRQLVDDAGIRPPSTWQELSEACLALQERGMPSPLVVSGGPAAGEAATYSLLALLASNGASILGPHGVTLDSPEAVEALSFLHSLVADGAVPVDVVWWGRSEPIRKLATGEAAFAFGGSYELPALADAAGIDQQEGWARFGFVPVPAGPSAAPATLAGGMALGIFRQSKSPELALRLVRAAVSAEAQLRMAATTGQIPTRVSVAADIAVDDSLLAQSSVMLDGAIVRPAVPTYDRLSQQLQTMFADVILNRATPEVASARTAMLISAITGLPIAR